MFRILFEEQDHKPQSFTSAQPAFLPPDTIEKTHLKPQYYRKQQCHLKNVSSAPFILCICDLQGAGTLICNS